MLYLYLYKISGGLISPPQTNTGLLFVTKDNVTQYQNTQIPVRGFVDRRQTRRTVRTDRARMTAG